MGVPFRKDVPTELTWDLSLIYGTEEAFQEDLKAYEALSYEMEKKYKGSMKTAQDVNACLDDLQELYRLQNLLGNYTSLAASVDYFDAAIQQKNDKFDALASEVASRLSFTDSEISQLPEEVLTEALAETGSNRGILKNIIRNKAHQLAPETERVLAALSQPLGNASYQVYNMSKLADMKFDSFTVNGEELPLGYALYENVYESDSRCEVRREAFRRFYDKLADYQNVTAAAYNNQVQTEKIMGKLRGFDSVFDYLLFSQDVTREMYDRQIDLIMNEFAPHMRKFARLKQKIHKLDRMTYADLKIAVDPTYAPSVTIPEAKEMVKEGLSILGEEYQAMVEEAFTNRWIDFANNQGKSTGGFCSSPYGKNSFILMSWGNRMSDVFTVAHELGHAGHFKACNAAQSLMDTDVSGYFVESPSTMNEILMTHYMLKKNQDPRFRRWVLANMVTNTYYHNFVTHLLEAAYQREVYKLVDAGQSVQAETLNMLFRQTLEKFWGDAVEIPQGAELTWMRQPHYYMGLYSYTYSAGLTIATQACLRIEREGACAVEDWKKVLAAGSTKSPMELAKMAGVDISTDQPLRDTIAYVGSVIDEICRLTEELGEVE